jgi:hypothetical protein
MIVFDHSYENLISILGALFDITGAAFLAWALVFVKARAIIRQSSSGYGFTPTLVKMFSEQKIDAAFGLVFLMVGFILQGGAGYGYKSTSNVLFGAGVAVLISGVIAYRLLRARLTRLVFDQACNAWPNPDGSARYDAAQIETFWTNAQQE